MNIYKIELFIIDSDDIGEQEIIAVLEDTPYPNSCISPIIDNVKSIQITDDEFEESKLSSFESELEGCRDLFNK